MGTGDRAISPRASVMRYVVAPLVGATLVAFSAGPVNSGPPPAAALQSSTMSCRPTLVTATRHRLAGDLVILSTDAGTIWVTPGHRFRTVDERWVPAAQLTVGDHVRSIEGRRAVTVLSTERTKVLPVPVYNLTVERAHAYFVGRAALLVHNACGDSSDDEGDTIDPKVLQQELQALEDQRARGGLTPEDRRRLDRTIAYLGLKIQENGRMRGSNAKADRMKRAWDRRANAFLEDQHRAHAAKVFLTSIAATRDTFSADLARRQRSTERALEEVQRNPDDVSLQSAYGVCLDREASVEKIYYGFLAEAVGVVKEFRDADPESAQVLEPLMTTLRVEVEKLQDLLNHQVEATRRQLASIPEGAAFQAVRDGANARLEALGQELSNMPEI